MQVRAWPDWSEFVVIANHTGQWWSVSLDRQGTRACDPRCDPEADMGTTRLANPLNLAHPAGLEPATSRLEGGCSIRLSYGCPRAAYSSSGTAGPSADRGQVSGQPRPIARELSDSRRAPQPALQFIAICLLGCIKSMIL